MTIQEFTDRTGFAPTESYYHSVIEPEYMASNIEKDDWCKQWKKNGGIQKAYDAICKDAAANKMKVDAYEKRITFLQNKEAELTEEVEALRDENEALRNDRKDRIDDRSKLMYSLIGISERYSSSELRELIINEIGFKAYIAYKLENDMNIWQLDKDAIIDNLK